MNHFWLSVSMDLIQSNWTKISKENLFVLQDWFWNSSNRWIHRAKKGESFVKPAATVARIEVDGFVKALNKNGIKKLVSLLWCYSWVHRRDCWTSVSKKTWTIRNCVPSVFDNGCEKKQDSMSVRTDIFLNLCCIKRAHCCGKKSFGIGNKRESVILRMCHIR